MRFFADKKIKTRALAALLLCALLFLLLSAPPAKTVNAEHNAYESYIFGPDNSLIKSPAAYNPDKYIPLSAKGAEDFFIDGGNIYLADTMQKAVRVLDEDGGEIMTYGLNDERVSDGTLAAPYGVYVRGDIVFVADKEKKAVVKFDRISGTFIGTLTKPVSPLFGISMPFVPLKVAVDEVYNIYVTGEGCPNGIIHLNMDGEFEGYLGVNKTPASLKALLQSVFFSQAQKDRLLNKVPPSPASLALDNRGLLYTVTPGNSEGSIKKLNTLGTVISRMGTQFNGTVGMDIDETYNIYSVDNNGNIVIYDMQGYPMFKFGGVDTLDRFGMLKSPSAIKVTDDLSVLVLDKETGAVTKYSPTDFYLLAHEAVRLYREGYYSEAEPLWEEIIRRNSGFIYGYSSLARASMKKGDYKAALDFFEKAEDLGGYSEAFWQVRSEWLQSYTVYALLVVFLIIILAIAVKQLKKRTRLLDSASAFLHRAGSVAVISRLKYSLYFIRHPIKAAEQMRYKNKLTVGPAVILCAIYVLISVLSIFFMGYMWVGEVRDVSIFSRVTYALLPLLLGIVCNYFVSSVTDGEGKFKYVFIAAVYSMTPYILFTPLLVILSNVLTYNEMIILTFIRMFIFIYCALLMVISIFAVHRYGFKGTVKNILLTAFCFVMVLLFVFILYLLFMKQFSFFSVLFGEAV